MKYLFTILFLVLTMNLSAQQGVNGKIQYDFHPGVDSLIAIAIDISVILETPIIDSIHGYFITFGFRDTTYRVVLDIYCKQCPIYDSAGEIDDWLGFLVRNTNRYTKITGREVPIILESDLRFGIIKLIDEPNFGRVKARLRLESRKTFKVIADITGHKIYEIDLYGY